MATGKGMNDQRDTSDRFVSSLRRLTLGVLAGGMFLIGVMLGLAGLGIACGLIQRVDSGRLDLGAWLLLEVAGGAIASTVAGVICRRLAGSIRAPFVLAGAVFTIGLLESVEILRAVTSGRAASPTWLVLVAPFVAAAGVLLGGSQLSRSEFAGVWHVVVRRLTATVVARYAVPAIVFAAATLLSLFALPRLPEPSKPGIVASALSFDLTIAVPGLVYMLLVRSRRAPWIILAPVAVVGYAMASAAIPSEHNAALNVIRVLAVPVELALIVHLARLARRSFVGAPAAGDFVKRFRTVARSALGSRVPADILTTELAILYYAFRWRRAALQDVETYTVHRRVGYAAVVVGLIIVLLVETVALHFLVSLWSHKAAWILTGLSGYACVWLVGDFRAMTGRLTRLTPTHLLVRMGLRWEADIPLEQIRDIEQVTARCIPRRRDILLAVLLGQPNLRISLADPVEFTGLYGLRRTVTEVWLTVDDAARFCDRFGSTS